MKKKLLWIGFALLACGLVNAAASSQPSSDATKECLHTCCTKNGGAWENVTAYCSLSKQTAGNQANPYGTCVANCAFGAAGQSMNCTPSFILLGVGLLAYSVLRR